MKEREFWLPAEEVLPHPPLRRRRIAKIAKEHKIPVSISKSPLQDVEAIAKDFDICFTTTKFSKEVGTEIVGVNGLITGIGEDETIELIVEKLKALSAE